MTRTPLWLGLACAAFTLAAGQIARCDPPPEPPGNEDPAADYAGALDDSMDAGSLSVGYGLAGRRGHSPGRSRSLRFRGDSVEAGVREGDDDPEDGSEISSRSQGRVLRVGRIAPAWGRGLLVGADADPWSTRDGRQAGRFAPRARGGDGVWCAWPRPGVDVFAGQLGARAAAGVSGVRDGWRLGVAGARGGVGCATLSLDRDDRAAELAVDGGGRWLAEATASRPAGPWEVALRARAGQQGYRSSLAPARVTPTSAAAVAMRYASGSAVLSATLAGWRFASDASGSRVGLETRWRDEQGGGWALGFEEQHGIRRAPSSAAAHVAGMRQGAWLEWRGETPAGSLSVRDELWGRRSFARGRVRRTLGVGVEATLPAGARLGVAHTVYRARSGETVHVPEREADRWVLRALSGAGDRTRATLRIPLAEGTLLSAITLGRPRGRPRAQWSLQWSRRVHLRRPA